MNRLDFLKTLVVAPLIVDELLEIKVKEKIPTVLKADSFPYDLTLEEFYKNYWCIEDKDGNRYRPILRKHDSLTLGYITHEKITLP